jgi:hypothetical protein
LICGLVGLLLGTNPTLKTDEPNYYGLLGRLPQVFWLRVLFGAVS